MSFNFLEIERAAGELARLLPDKVQGAELVRFPLGKGQVSDVNVGLRLEKARRLVVFSLKAPWVGLFVLPPNLVQPAGTRGKPAAWATAFNGCEGPAQDWNSYIHERALASVEVTKGDRVVTLRFEGGAVLVVELIPARPNWILHADGREFRWRDSVVRPGLAPRADGTLTARDFGGTGDWMEAAYRHYLALRQKQLLQTAIQRAASELQGRAAKVAKTRGQMREAMVESEKADELRIHAEALKGRLHELPSTKKAASFEGVELDPRYTPAENVSRMFSKYKKLQRTKKEVEARLEGVEEESRKLAGAVARLRGFKGDYPEFLKLATELELETGEPASGAEGRKAPKSERKWAQVEKKGVRRFQSKEGLAIWVGRNHKENEELVIRLARGNDMWLHLKGRHGAHGVIQLPGGKSPSLETLLDAATLVAYYSGIRENDKVEVDYTFRKHVKRVAGVGGEKFLVTYSQNKTLMVKVEETRLWHLLKQHS